MVMTAVMFAGTVKEPWEFYRFFNTETSVSSSKAF